MKIIFLDIDGVLNTFKTFETIYHEYKCTGKKRLEIDLERLDYLKDIVDKTGALIVLSSSWRYSCNVVNDTVVPKDENMKQLIELFKQYGLVIYDITPKDVVGIRQVQICSWLINKEVDSFIVLDDESYDLGMFESKELIRTNFWSKDGTQSAEECGLCEKHVKQAIDILNKNDKRLNKIL